MNNTAWGTRELESDHEARDYKRKLREAGQWDEYGMEPLDNWATTHCMECQKDVPTSDALVTGWGLGDEGLCSEKCAEDRERRQAAESQARADHRNLSPRAQEETYNWRK